MGYNCFGGLGLKTVKNSKKAKDSFVDACITHCPNPFRFNNSQQKVLPGKIDKIAPRALIAQRGRNWSCEYFYRSLGCPQLTSSSSDVRMHFRVAGQRVFKGECKRCGALSCFI